jgi:hypothetical protein
VSFRIAEVFGYGAANIDRAVWKSRVEKKCPFFGSRCTKGNVADPLGVGSIEEGSKRAMVCPVRFLEKREILNRAARLAFGRFGGLDPADCRP